MRTCVRGQQITSTSFDRTNTRSADVVRTRRSWTDDLQETKVDAKDRIAYLRPQQTLRLTVYIIWDNHLKSLASQIPLKKINLNKNEVDWCHSYLVGVSQCLFPGLELPILVDGGFGNGSQALHQWKLEAEPSKQGGSHHSFQGHCCIHHRQDSRVRHCSLCPVCFH